jgi:hypothetical protein
MRKYIPYILILVVLTGTFSILTSTYASNVSPGETCVYDNANKVINSPCVPPSLQKDGSSLPYVLLAPISDMPPTFNPKDEGSFGIYLNLMIKIFIGLCAVLAVVMLVIGGIEYMTSELMSSKEAGRERMTNAVLGLLIALGAYALLYTINPNLLNTDLSSLTDATIEVAVNDAVPQTYDPITKKYRNGATFGASLTGTPLQNCATNTQIGCIPLYVTLNNNELECTTIGQKNCTSTIGLDMNKVKTIQWGCECSLVITGGTEWWLHGGETGKTTHQNGSTTVDLRPDPKLNAYLIGNQPLVANKWYQSPVGQVLYEVHNGIIHWHIGG